MGRFSSTLPPPATFHACSGCDVCALSCPVWQQTRDVRLTPKGRAVALQGGATPQELIESAVACTMCGACVPACPEKIDLVAMTLALRAEAGDRNPLAPLAAAVAAPDRATPRSDGKTVLLPEPRLADDLPLLSSAILRLGGPSHVVVADDHGRDIAAALEAGLPIPDARLQRFAAPLRRALRVVTCDGFFHRFLRDLLPGVPIQGLGEASLALDEVRRAITHHDLYAVDARAYHADWLRLVRVYDALRRETGCLMNLDLQRFAIPTAASSLQGRAAQGPVGVHAQARWILEGRAPRRVIVENLDDGDAFREMGVEVVHVAQVAVVSR
jgi:ferredoxin